MFAGSPQIADPQSLIFSPPYLLLALVNGDPSFQAVDAVTFAMLWLAGIAIILFCMDRGWAPTAAIVAAFAFANGGSAAWRVQHTGEVVSFCWFGITLWLLGRALNRRSKAYGFWSGVTAAMMVIGRDQIAYLCALALLIFAIAELFGPEGFWKRLKGAFPPLAIATIAGAILIVLPIALTIALAAQSIRVDIGYEGAARGSLPPASFVTLIVANLFGTDGPLKDYWGPPSSQIWGPNELALARNMADVYIGALPVVAIAAIGLLRGALGRREILGLTIASIVMILFSLGDFTPFFRFAYQLPGINLFRRPADATFPIGGLLALLGGYCVHVALRDRPRGRTQYAVETALVACLLAFCAWVAFDKGRLGQAAPSLALGFGLLAASGVALALCARIGARNAAAATLIAAGMLTIDLAVSNGPNESTALPPATYDVLRPETQNETIALLKHKIAENAAPDRRDRVEMAAVGFEWPNVGMIQGFDHWLGYNPIVLKDFADATGAIDHVAIPEQRKFSALFPRYRSPMADLLGVRWIATGVPAAELDKAFQPGDLVEIARTKDAYVYENPRALPRVLMATEARKADFDAMMKSGEWPEVDFLHTVLLENPPASDTTLRAAGTARLESYANTRVIVDADSPAGGWVVLADVWHPWWVATVDGEPAAIERANVIFRAVAVPPGRHRVEFVFRPLSGVWRQMRALF